MEMTIWSVISIITSQDEHVARQF